MTNNEQAVEGSCPSHDHYCPIMTNVDKDQSEKQQVRGSSPLASSLTRADTASRRPVPNPTDSPTLSPDALDSTPSRAAATETPGSAGPSTRPASSTPENGPAGLRSCAPLHQPRRTPSRSCSAKRGRSSTLRSHAARRLRFAIVTRVMRTGPRLSRTLLSVTARTLGRALSLRSKEAK
jgi:hypothetical protein